MTEQDEKTYKIVRKLFKNDRGEPFEMTQGQISIFRAIYEKQNPRIQIETYTQYGKSDIISMAVLLRATTFAERIPILAPSTPKAKIIMEKVIKHIFENEYTKSKFRIDRGESMERVKRQRNQTKLTFRVNKKGDIGEIFVLSAEARRKGEDAGDILMGFGAPNLIEDESALIPDRLRGKIIRMLGGHKENFMCKIGNTFGRGHFYRTHNDEKYQVITIDYQQGIKEGRITEEFIDEARGETDNPTLFKIMYECKFPKEEEIDEENWMTLISEDEVRDAMKRDKIEPKGIRRLGVDVARGGRNYNVWYLRTNNFAKRIKKNKDNDLMNVAKTILTLMKEYHIEAENVYVDDVGYGGGVCDRLKELGFEINAVVEQAKAEDTEKYANEKAEMYSEGAKWIREGGTIEKDEDLAFQIIKTRWKKNSSGKLLIKPKALLRLEGLESPDDLDAFMLTFAKQRVTTMSLNTAVASPKAEPYYPELGI